MKKQATRVALYARVSTRDEGQDTENRLAQLRQFAATQNWTVAQEYVDCATGKHSDRDQFQRLFQDASQPAFDVVLFWSLDRFSIALETGRAAFACASKSLRAIPAFRPERAPGR